MGIPPNGGGGRQSVSSKTDHCCGAVTGVKFPSIICRAVAYAVRLESWSTVCFIFVH